MLQDEVTAFVEGALERTTPGKAFTLAVLAALPVSAASSATAATLGAAAKVGTAAKAVSVAGLAAALLGPIIGILGAIFGASCSIKNTKSPRERQFMIRQTWLCVLYVLLFFAVFSALMHFRRSLATISPFAFECAQGVLIAGYAVGLLVFITTSNRRQRQIRIEDGTDESLKQSPPPTPSRKQQLWGVYGTLGGSTAGTLAWIVVRATRASDWITALATILFGAAVVLLGGSKLMRKPGSWLRVILQTLALLALFTLMIGFLHPEWFAKE